MARPFTNTEMTDPSCAGLVREFCEPSALSATVANSSAVSEKLPGTTNKLGFAEVTGNASAGDDTPLRVTCIAGNDNGPSVTSGTAKLIWFGETYNSGA